MLITAVCINLYPYKSHYWHSKYFMCQYGMIYLQFYGNIGNTCYWHSKHSIFLYPHSQMIVIYSLVFKIKRMVHGISDMNIVFIN